ncbi:hypothetical protein WN71_015490 [Streptomyces mangrovisoli]|uniref:Copper-containing nitrite reductase n=1 Tax=Streptomyces mangrovisoli TaxID=1428628 RepID=A0A1J4P0M7_9ACTN|nr:hypothetical protein WN71_015490 [Streptomyces mangrovisoli]
MTARHLRAHVVVVVWVGLALPAAGAQQSLPVARWLAIHLFLLGAATTAVVVWSEHFAVALLHAARPDERWSDARLAAVNLAVAGVLTGVATDLPALTGVACALLVGAVTAHLVVLVRMGRGALGGRLAPVVGYYRAAAAALLTGAVLGGLLATGHAGAGHYGGLRLAHIHVTLLGWIGLPVLGTLFMLWPTVLGVRMAERTTSVARRVLGLTGGGLAVAVAGLTAGWRLPAVVGVLVYGAGLALAVDLFARTVRGRNPAAATGAASPASPDGAGSPATAVGPGRAPALGVGSRRAPLSAAAVQSSAAALGWLCAGVAADAVVLAVRPLDRAGEQIDTLVPVLILGVVAQILIGALSYLLPIVLSGGPKERTALQAVLERGRTVRLVALNAGLVLVAAPLPGPCGTVGALLAAAAGAVFAVLTAMVLVRGARRTGTGGSPRRPVLLGSAAGALLVVLAVLVANSGGVGNDSTGNDSAGRSGTGAVAAGEGADGATVVRTVDVTLADMRIRPSRIDITAGTALKLKVTNKDAQRHDLKVDGGPATPLLADGESRTLDLGTITADRTAWCTLPGHRAAGMTLDIVVQKRGQKRGQKSEQKSGQQGTGQDSMAGMTDDGQMSTGDGTGLDLTADFSRGWTSRDPALAPARGGTVHRVTLHAGPRTVEVAPGVKQRMWTFGGTAPGPTLHGKVGDVFEVTLVNDDPAMGHGVDFHAGSLAPDEAMRTVRPGGRLVYRFRADHAGAWLYHCSTAPMLQHMGNGMYGAVVIDPPGLAKVDHEYVLVSSELYLGTPGSAAQVAKMRQDDPDAWVFNGVAAQYAKAPLKVKAGERARFWVVAAGPSDGVSFHIVGTVFDTVYKEGAYLLEPGGSGGSQALDLSVAQGGFVETTFPAAGHYSFVDHDMRHAERGAAGTVEVTDR